MINFASLFNQFRSQTNSGLSEILDQAGVKMGRLLDQDSFVGQYKSANPKIVEFMKYERYLELIEFITVVGSPLDKKRGYKYPLSTSDLLCIDNSQALQFFLPEKPIIEETKVVQTFFEDVEIQVESSVEPSQTTQPTQIKQQGEKKEQKPEVVANVQGEVEKTVQNQSKQASTQEQNSKPITQQKQIAQGTKDIAEKIQKTSQIKFQKQITKMIVKQERKIQKTVKKQLSPLITKLLLYFDEPVNYTLAGYVSKVLSYLFTKKSAECLKYIFEEGVTSKILNHAESRSVGDFIVKILTIESTLYLQKRGELFKDLLQRLSSFSDVHVMSNLSAYACEVIEKIAANLKGNNKVPELSTHFFSLQVITEVIKNVMNDEENISIYNAPILFTYLTNVPFVLPQDADIVAAFKSLLEEFIDKSLEKLKSSTENRPKFGVGRIKIVEILKFILKENILNAKEIIGGKKNFFPILFGLMKKYTMNNLLHNQIVKILDIALSQPESSPLNKVLFQENVLLNFIVEQAKEDIDIRSGNSVYKTRKGYIAHLINLAIKLKQLTDKNGTIKVLTNTEQFSGIFESFIEKEVFKTKRNLAGYTMKKEQKHQIMFQKEDIIANYITFFQKCPAAVFETEPEPKNIDHPDLVQELQKQLEQNLHVKPKEQSQNEENKQIEELINEKTPEVIQAEAESQTGYWVKHLNYNVDDLMADL